MVQLLFCRYICSSGEKESKSVISLFDDFLSSWVCVTLSFIDDLLKTMFLLSFLFTLWYYACNGIVEIFWDDVLFLVFFLGRSSIFLSIYNDVLSFTWKEFYFQDKKHPGVPPPRLFTVGRLDVATTGLLIVTNDGMWFLVKAILSLLNK